MTAKMGNYVRDQLFHAISRHNNSTTVNFMYFTHDMIEELQVLNGPPCILSGYLLIILNNVITRSGIDQATMGIQD